MEVSNRSLCHIKIRDLLVAAKICRYLMCNEAAIHSRDFYTISVWVCPAFSYGPGSLGVMYCISGLYWTRHWICYAQLSMFIGYQITTTPWRGESQLFLPALATWRRSRFLVSFAQFLVYRRSFWISTLVDGLPLFSWSCSCELVESPLSQVSVGHNS